MAAMNVLPPDAITRVTDYLPDIVQFVSDLEAKGFAYRGARSGSLWFDTVAYGARYGLHAILCAQAPACYRLSCPCLCV